MGKNCPRCNQNFGRGRGCPAPAGSLPPLMARDLMRKIFRWSCCIRNAFGGMRESGTCEFGAAVDRVWSPRQESNLYLALRRHPFYPLNYEERRAGL